MKLSIAILGLLYLRPMSGYDLKNTFGESFMMFWSCTTSQIYRELNNLYKDGLINMQIVNQEKNPTKKLYSINEEGIKELRGSVQNADPLDFLKVRHNVLVYTFLGIHDEEQFQDKIKVLYNESLEKIVVLEASEKELKKMDSSMDEQMKYWMKTIDYGKMFYKMQAEWCKKNI